MGRYSADIILHQYIWAGGWSRAYRFIKASAVDLRDNTGRNGGLRHDGNFSLVGVAASDLGAFKQM